MVLPNYDMVAHAVLGLATGTSIGVGAISEDGTALFASSTTGLAMHTSGNVRLQGIGGATGKILVSDATGNATWQKPPKITLDQSSATGQSAVEFRNQGSYVGSFGWSQASTRYFLYD